MYRGRRSHGFTIIEVMIVLAVTGTMFLMAAALIGGKQNKTEFDTATRDFVSQLNTLGVAVTNGTTNIDFAAQGKSCSATTGTPPGINISTATSQGSDNPCMFVGQEIGFTVSGGNYTTDGSYTVTPLVGAQYAGGNNTATSTATGNVGAAANPSQSIADSGAYLLTAYQQKPVIEYGATVGCILYANTPVTALTPTTATPCNGYTEKTSGVMGSTYYKTGTISFFATQFGRTYVPPTVGTSQSVQVNTSVLRQLAPDSTPPANPSNNSQILYYTQGAYSSTNTNGGYVQNPAGGVFICLDSGTTNEHAVVTLGGIAGGSFVSEPIISGGKCS